MSSRLVTDDVTGRPKIVLGEPGGATAEIQLFGGHVTSWKNKEGEDLIFLSPRANTRPLEPIRGGIQVCFPEFGGSGALQQRVGYHGHACNRMWQIDPDPPPAPPRRYACNSPAKPYVDLLLVPKLSDLWTWPNDFSLRQRITLGSGGELKSDIRIENLSSNPITFTFALLNYLSVSDIKNVRIAGLATLDFLDRLQSDERKKERHISMKVKELDRIYLGTPAEIAMTDIKKHRTFVLNKDENLPDVVLWSPSRKKNFANLKARLKAWIKPNRNDDEYRDERKVMLCVGAAAAERAITLQPGEKWTASQEISSVYYFGQEDLPGP